MNIKNGIIVMAFSLFLYGCNVFEAPSDHLDYQTKAPLIFPVKGESLVIFGGRTLDTNHHAGSKDQRFAMDIVGLKPGSQPPVPVKFKESDEIDDYVKTYSGDKRVNENYYLFGREVIAPADGVIVSSRGDLKDNIPGENTKSIGNFVVIDHGNNEYSMMAHFKQYSLKVLAGQSVKAGDVIGLVGNSGASAEPHLHYHLQNTSKWSNDSEGLPAQFINYISNGELVERGEPVQWELISAQ